MIKSKPKFLVRGSEPFDIEIARAQGSYLYTTRGKKYVDFVMGWCVGNLGWNHSSVMAAIKAADCPSYVYPSLQYKRWDDLAEILSVIAPGKLRKCFRATGGSEAVEIAMQMAMIYTGRSKFLSVEGAYHGNTLGALSIGATKNRERFPNLLSGCLKLDPPLDAMAVLRLESKLESGDVAAVIMEPFFLNLAVLEPEAKFMEGLQKVCRKHGTLLIMDEVATGFGRTGRMFGTDHFNIEPDIMCLAKAITGGHAGMGAVMATTEIAEETKDHMSFWSTYGWHPLSVEAAIANVTYLTLNFDEIMANVVNMEHIFRARLEGMPFENGVTIHSKGLAIAADVGDAEYAERISDKCLEKGLIIDTRKEWLLFFPALNIDEKTATEGLDILEKCV